MPTARVRSALSRIPLGRALIVLGLVVVGINICSAIWDVRTARERTERRAQRDFSNVTSVLAEQTAAALEAADLVLRDAARIGAADKVLAAAPRFRDELPQIATFLLFDAEGRLLSRSREAAAIDPELAKRFFLERRDAGGEGLYMSRPYRGGPEGASWRFFMTRPLNAPDGTFGGALAALIEIESFDRLYRAIDLGEGAFISLISLDGVVITRVPDPANVRGRQVAGGEVIAGVHRDGRYQGWATSPIVNERVLLSASAVRGFPLLVATGSNQVAVFAPWRDEARLIGVRTLLSSAAMLALIGLAAWGLARREAALQRKEKQFRAMIEHSSDAVVMTRPKQGGIVYASPAFQRITGYTGEELRGREVVDLVHPDEHATAVRLRAELLGSPGKVVTNELRVLHKDGSWRWVELTRNNLLKEPNVRAVVMNFREISERKHADAERARLEQRLRQAEKMEAVGRLAGGIAHDFNNILGGILGYAEMLAEKSEPGSALRRYADNVLTGANRASALVEQILSYSRSQRGKRAPVELGRVVSEALGLVGGSLAGGIRLETELPATPLFVVGDPTQLHQVTMNLCTNALQAMGESGTLRVGLEAAEVEADRALAHTTLNAGSYARLTVADTGTGMDAATLARVFEPFFTTKEVGKGTGLGLSLVYGIVTDSGGAIDVDSAVGRGSRFAIYLPRVDSPVIADDPATGPIARGNGERVLVVDDEEAIAAVTSEVLKNLGYVPVTCADGNAALAAFQAAPERIDAVIADEVMPGLTGTELARSLRGPRPGLPIILMSGYTGPMMTERALAAGVTEILKKPLQSRDIAAALARVLRRA
ncbi:MAG TPA: PAS domain S-box protein [Burkholderiales bacterium]|nr:PAS domain S-box protein [Burkholderiales bacterium]